MFKTKSLPPEIVDIVVNKGTEYPGSGEYEENEKPGPLSHPEIPRE